MGIHGLKVDSYFFRKAGNHVLDYTCSMSIFTRDFSHFLAPCMDAYLLNSHHFWDSMVCDR